MVLCAWRTQLRASLAVYLSRGFVLFSVGIPAIACSMLGNHLGSKYAIKGVSSKIRLVMFFVLALPFIRFALDLTGIADFLMRSFGSSVFFPTQNGA